MKPLTLCIPADTKNKEVLYWLLKTALLALNLKNVQLSEKENTNSETLFPENGDFRTRLTTLDLQSPLMEKLPMEFNKDGIITSDGVEDELLTAFYLINCLQEYANPNKDQLGRFSFENSYQQRFGKIENNFVTELFEKYFKKHFHLALKNRVFEKSSFFFSHDIDSLYGAFLQDGLAAVKKGRLDIIAKLVMNAVLLKPDWFNLDKIIKMESEYELRSTFFWIVNKGRVSKTLTNADYAIETPRIQKTLQTIIDKGAHIGLHKSVSNESFDQELKKLGKATHVNRNHYLKFDLPNHFNNIEASSLKIDCSLGFAEHYGFRNSLAIPFVPFNVKENRPYHFLEIPLNIMDGTFQKYMGLSPSESTRRILEFIEKNKSNAVLSVLWHNHFFSSFRFKGFFEPYKELLDYLKEQQFPFTNPDQLYQNFYHDEKLS